MYINRINSVAKSGGAWQNEKITKQQIIESFESLLDNDGFSLPFKGSKPMRIKDILRSIPDSPQPIPNKNLINVGTGRNSNLAIQGKNIWQLFLLYID